MIKNGWTIPAINNVKTAAPKQESEKSPATIFFWFLVIAVVVKEVFFRM